MISSPDRAKAFADARAYALDLEAGKDTNTPNGSIDPFNFVLVHGAWFDPTYLQPLAQQLRDDQGHGVITPNLAAEDTSKTFDDDAAQVKQEIENRSNIILVTHSRGVEVAPRLLKMLSDESRLENVTGVIVLNSAGPHGIKPTPLYPGEPDLPRYTDEFEALKPNDIDDRSTFAPEAAEKVFLHNIRDRRVRQKILQSMRAQRSASISKSPLPVMPSEIPVHIIQGVQERAINLQRADRVFMEWIGKRAIPVDGGHMWPLEQPQNAATALIKLAVQSYMHKNVFSA